MIKKISALLLALVLCLSVVVVPASAYELASGSEIAYVIELDKNAYSAGEMVTVNLFIYGKEGLEFGTGAILVAMNSDVFDMSENSVDDIKATSTSGDAMASWYKDFTSASISWLTQSTVINNVNNANTAEEKAMYNQYLKIGLAKNTAGSHPNVSGNKNGLPAEDINADSEAGVPFVSFQLKIRDDVADDTPVCIGITTGSMSKTQTYVNYYKKPGSATTVVKTKLSTSEVVSSTDAVIGAASTPFPTETIVSPLKGQIRFHKNADGTYAKKFDIRALAVISGADFNATFGSVEAAESMIKEAGFVFAAGSNVANPTFDAVKGLVEDGTEAAGYTKKTIEFISTSTQPGDYVFSCIVTDMEDADKANSLVAVGYLAVDTDADGAADDYYYYTDVQTISFADLFGTHYDKAFPA